MIGGFAPRFALEAGFLLLLAVGAGLADLRPALIVAVMAAGWALVTLIEWLAWRAARQAAESLRVAARPAAEREYQPTPAWDLADIIAPAAEPVDEAEAPERTTVLPPEGPVPGEEGRAGPQGPGRAA